MLGAIEAGGTKFVCAVGTRPDDLESIEIPTRSPQETLPQVVEYFSQHPVSAIGLACFGPIDLNRQSPTYGHITATPKLAWRNFDIVGWLQSKLHVPMAFDTDVNAAALGEGTWGAARGVSNYVYFTVGTGIGGGALCDGKLIHGSVHPEMGHIPVRRHPKDEFEGVCPSHHDCLEGLASGPAITKRWKTPAQNIGPDHAAWEMEAYYLAQAALTAAMMLSSELIVFGGGVSRAPGLIDQIDFQLRSQLAGYLTKPPRVVHTALEAAGLVGALILAKSA